MPPLLRRLGWFALFWLAGVAAVALLALFIKIWL
jgi:hypothetical protein